MSNSLWPMDGSPPLSSVHGILQTRILEGVAMPSSRGSSPPRDRTYISCIEGRFFTIEPLGKPKHSHQGKGQITNCPTKLLKNNNQLLSAGTGGPQHTAPKSCVHSGALSHLGCTWTPRLGDWPLLGQPDTKAANVVFQALGKVAVFSWVSWGKFLVFSSELPIKISFMHEPYQSGN